MWKWAKTWESMGKCVKTWESMRKCVKTWESVAKPEKVRKSVPKLKIRDITFHNRIFLQKCIAFLPTFKWL